MSDYIRTPLDTDSSEFQGSVLRGILGSVVGMAACVLVLWLCWLVDFNSLMILLQLFVGAVIGWFYRLFHGRRSKSAAYVVVGVCTMLTCLFWMPVLAAIRLSGEIPLSRLAQMLVEARAELWSRFGRLLLLFAGLGLIGLFFSRGRLLAYVDWRKGPWYIAGFNAGGAAYNMLPEKLPDQRPPERFAVSSRFTSGERVVVEGDTLRWIRSIRRDRAFTCRDIAGVVLGPSGGSNVIFDQNYQVLAKFAGSMENADLLLRWLMEQNIPIHNAPDGWRVLPEEGPVFEEQSTSREQPSAQRQFTLRLNKSTRRGFTGIGVFLLLFGIAFAAVLVWWVQYDPMTPAELAALVVLDLILLVLSILFLRMGKVCRVEVDGERIRAYSRFGRPAEFSVREVADVSRSIGWIVLYDKEWKPLAKLDPGLEHLEQLENYLAAYGVRM